MTDKKVGRELPVSFEKIKEYEVNDTRFMSVRIWILHTGLNYNNSVFEKETVEKNLHTLANTPVLAFIEENSQGEIDFSDHRMTLERNSDGEYKYRYLGSAIGVIPETHNAHWEYRESSTGEQLEYLVCDALIWKKWDEPIDIFNREQKTWQSMELSENYTGYWNDEGNFVFNTFEFNGACLLSNVDTLPAMDNSTAELIFTKGTINNAFLEIKEKLDMFNKAFSKQQEGGEKMSEEVVVVEEVVEEVVQETKENFETVENVEVAEETVETETEVVVEEQEAIETVEEFDYKSAYEALTDDFTSLKANYETLEKEVTSLREFQSTKLSEERTQAETELFERFSSELTEEDLQEVKEKSSDFSLEQLEEKLFTILGKKKATFSKQPKKEKQPTVKVEIDSQDDKETSPYGSLFM